MQEANLFLTFIRPLNNNLIEYAVTGSMAVIIYGEPRVTHDIDLIISIKRHDLPKFKNVFPASDFYCPPIESLEAEYSRTERGHFNIIHYGTGFKADFYLLGTDKLIQWALARSRTIYLEKEPVKIAPPEYVIIKKLEFYREGGSSKHISDIKSILNYSSGNIDRVLLDNFIREYSLTKEWDKVLTGLF